MVSHRSYIINAMRISESMTCFIGTFPSFLKKQITFCILGGVFVVGLKNKTCLISGRQTPKYKTKMKSSGRGGTPKLERQDVYLFKWITGQERSPLEGNTGASGMIVARVSVCLIVACVCCVLDLVALICGGC